MSIVFILFHLDVLWKPNKQTHVDILMICIESTTNHSNQFYLKSRPTKTHYQTIFCISKFIDPATIVFYNPWYVYCRY